MGNAAKPVVAIGDFFAMALDAVVLTFRPPFAWREFLLQTWFVALAAERQSIANFRPYVPPASTRHLLKADRHQL